MEILIVADGHYYKDKYGDVYVDSVFDYTFYKRYISIFDKVYAIARIKKVKRAPENCKLASGEGIEFLPIPETHGIKEFLLHYMETRALVVAYLKYFDKAIIRLPGVIGNLVAKQIDKTGKKYAIEVVVDPWEYFGKGTIKGFVRPIIQITWTRLLKKVCKHAIGVSYVTEKYLQNKYPCKAILMQDNVSFTASYSSVELPDNIFGMPRVHHKKEKYIIAHVANAFTGYGKGHIELMDVVKKIIDKGYNIEINFVGDGKLKNVFQKYAEKKGISSKTHFLGKLPDSIAVRNTIKNSDFFVFPTRAEGLPRVILEAMAEGLPVISSPVCGIPEIIEKKYLFHPNNIDGMAEMIIWLIENPEEMDAMSRRNIEKALEFRSSLLRAKRIDFYKKVAEM